MRKFIFVIIALSVIVTTSFAQEDFFFEVDTSDIYPGYHDLFKSVVGSPNLKMKTFDEFPDYQLLEFNQGDSLIITLAKEAGCITNLFLISNGIDILENGNRFVLSDISADGTFNHFEDKVFFQKGSMAFGWENTMPYEIGWIICIPKPIALFSGNHEYSAEWEKPLSEKVIIDRLIDRAKGMLNN